jgi:hypothetical protein
MGDVERRMSRPPLFLGLRTVAAGQTPLTSRQ